MTTTHTVSTMQAFVTRPLFRAAIQPLLTLVAVLALGLPAAALPLSGAGKSVAGGARVPSPTAEPVFIDRDGARPSAGRTVFRIGDARAAEVAGLARTHRAGWYELPSSELGIDSAKARAAKTLASYSAPAFLDRLGGLAWPNPAILIGFRPFATAQERASATAAAGGAVERYSHLPDLVQIRLELASGSEVLARAAALSRLPGVAFAEPDMSFTGQPDLLPNDQLFPSAWEHRNTGQSGGLVGFDIRTPIAWDFGTGRSSVTVLVIDTGVEGGHPDLNLNPGRDFTTGAVGGVAGGGPTNSFENHGTSVAGCISGRIGNSIGSCGVAPGCPSVSARCFNGTNSNGSWTADYSWTANALNWALANGIRITNNSNFYGLASSAVEQAYGATRASGAIHFASAGNNANTNITFPASIAPVLAVGAVDRAGNRSSFSCFGPLLDFMAPGTSVTSTDRMGAAGYVASDYVTVSGTSFASPIAAGIAALMRSRNPAISPDEITAILNTTARNMGVPGYDTNTGWGLLQASAAVAAVVPSCPADIDRDGAVDARDLALVLGAWGPCGLCPPDLNRDGAVDAADMTVVLGAWGTSCP